MSLHPQDVIVVLKFLVDGSKNRLQHKNLAQPKADDVAGQIEQEFLAAGHDNSTYAELGKDLAMSPSQVFRSVDRAEQSGLLYRLQPISWPNRANLKEFLIHGVKYAFPVQRGSIVRGIPTAHAAPPLKQQIAESSDPPPVWPDPEGTVRGLEFSPLYKNVPAAARRDPELYELLALVDAIRDGRAREREIAINELGDRIDER
jgi:DNA-binding Lrp family transcriptional regulator